MIINKYIINTSFLKINYQHNDLFDFHQCYQYLFVKIILYSAASVRGVLGTNYRLNDKLPHLIYIVPILN